MGDLRFSPSSDSNMSMTNVNEVIFHCVERFFYHPDPSLLFEVF